MKTTFWAVFGLLLLTILAAREAKPARQPLSPADERFYEMRTYYAEPGRLNDLLARFRNHTTQLFKKHGMTNVGYWVPTDNSANKLVYILSYPSREAREQAWKAFFEDPQWKKTAQASEKKGKLVAKVESVYLKTTDFSPELFISKAHQPRAFELRTYKTTPGKLPALLTRFRDYTAKLFEKHGMTNLIYWTPTELAQGADDTLIYLLAHPSKEAGLQSFEAFSSDPDWQQALKASEEKAGGSLTVSVVSEYLVSTDFSPLQ